MCFLIDHAVYKIKQWILGKGILEYSLSALVSHRRISLCIGKPPYQELKSSHSLHWTYHLVWEYPSLFQAQRTLYFLSLLKACALYSTWPTLRLYLSSEGRGGSFHYSTRVVHVSKLLLCQPPGETCWPWGTSKHYWR